MTQVATVERVLDAGYVEISVSRKTACGHDCEECAGCGVTGSAVYARALNPINAKPGEKVLVESNTNAMLKIIILVYLIPVLLFLAGYVSGVLLSDSAAVQYTIAGSCFILGVLLAIGYDRKVKARGGLTFWIVRLL